MGNALQQLKRQGRNKPSLSNAQMKRIFDSKDSFNAGFDAGAKRQREADIKYLVKIFEDLETVPGIGKKTAGKVREYFNERFGVNQL
ncbi:hypothetical protein ACQKP0_24985 [Heyndrickxia sp. NPDC080065]|uniref:hypothetical protein n=1 Tax=Heyndrickxia sp. NPDC080065 TaxID=3390568 RepID=UPI003CFE69D3